MAAKICLTYVAHDVLEVVRSVLAFPIDCNMPLHLLSFVNFREGISFTIQLSILFERSPACLTIFMGAYIQLRTPEWGNALSHMMFV
jgi:hypothetical protein